MRRSSARSFGAFVAVSLVTSALAIIVSGPDAAAQTFSTLQPPFTQSVYGAISVPNLIGGVAFAPNGDVLVDNCSLGGGPLYRFDHASTAPVTHGTATLHPFTQETSDAGCGLINHTDGAIYTNTSSGVVKLDANTGAQIGGPFGPAGNGLGITEDPQSGNLVYVLADGSLGYVNAALTTSGAISTITSGFVDQITFDPSGNYLFVSADGADELVILHRDGALVQSIPLIVGSGPDGIAFHATSPHFVVTNNNDGTMTRYDFPSNPDNFSATPTQTLFASGGFRGDNAQVGSDGCLYATQDGIRYDDGTTDATTNSLVRICPGFQPPPGVRSGTLLAFGDSVAAGYGLGPDGNSSAYPAILAATLGLTPVNLATSGACVSSTDAPAPRPGNCTGSNSGVSVAQQETSAIGLSPSVITLTAGANDIAFDQCFEAAFDLTANGPADPCAPGSLASNLAALGSSLRATLQQTAHDFPNVPIVVTGYYNPLPPVPPTGLACGDLYPLSFADALNHLSGSDITWLVLGLLLRPDAIQNGLRSYQAAIFSRGQSIVTALNGTIQAAVKAVPSAHFVPLNFAGHDFCRPAGAAWAFGPRVAERLVISHLFAGPQVIAAVAGGSVACPSPGKLDPSLTPTTFNFSFFLPALPPITGISGSFSPSVNCTPHPTAPGQLAISSMIAPVAAPLVP